MYCLCFTRPTNELGSFEKIRAGGEINQTMNVMVVKERGFKQDNFGNITAFYASDKSGELAIVTMNSPAPAELLTATKVEIFGHMHDTNFVANRITVIE